MKKIYSSKHWTSVAIYLFILISFSARSQSITTSLGSNSLCAGASVNVSYTAAGTFTGGNVFSAQLSNPGGTFSSYTVIGSLVATASGIIAATIPAAAAGGTTYRIRVVASTPLINGSDNGSDVTITAIPARPAALLALSGSATVCPGDIRTYYVATVAGASGYTWTSGSPGGTIINHRSGSLADSVDVQYDVNLGTTYSLSVTADNSCGSSIARVLFVSKGSPPTAPGVISGPTTGVCASSSGVSYSVPAVAGVIYNWFFTSTVDAVITQNGSNTITINFGSNWSTGTLSVTASFGTTCGISPARTLAIASKPSALVGIGTLGGFVSVCPGDLKTYYTPAVSGASGYTWSNSSPGGSIINHRSSALADSIDVLYDSNLLAFYTLAVTADNACGSTASRTLIIAKNIPATPGLITGPANEICAGTTGVSYSVPSATGITFNWYFTTAVDAVINQTGSNTVTVDYGSNWLTGTLAVTASNGTTCGLSTPRNAIISSKLTVNSTIATLGGSVAVCPGDFKTYYLPNVPGASGYTWSSASSGGTIMNHRSGATADTVDVQYDTNLGANFILSVTADNSCGSSIPKTLPVYRGSPPSIPPAITGPATEVCAGTTGVTYSVPAVPGVIYNWFFTKAVDAVINQTGDNTVTIDFGPNWVMGTLNVTASYGTTCGSSGARALIIVSIPATLASIKTLGGAVLVCPGDFKTYYLNKVAGANGYTWSTPSSGGTIMNERSSATVDTVDVLFDSALGASFALVVTGDNACGSSVPSILTIFKNIPLTPVAIVGPTTKVCAGTTGVNYLVASAPGYTFNWAFLSPVDAVINQDGSYSMTVDYGPNWTSGTLGVTASNGTTCGLSALRTTSISSKLALPGSIFTLGGSAAVCPGDIKTYYLATVPGASDYTWSSTSPGGTIVNHRSSATADSVDVQYDNNLGLSFLLSVTANNSCGSSVPRSISVFKRAQYYLDADGDGYGNPNVSAPGCSAPAGYVSNNLDCNDGDSTIHPNAIESCNGVDDNCNGKIDEGALLAFYTDSDGDGYGAGDTIYACTQPAGTSIYNTDCNDNDSTIHPGAKERYNGIDDDCNGLIDDGLVLIRFYIDADHDGYGTVTDTGRLFLDNPGRGYAVNNTDCNDHNANIHPGKTEVCNGIDDNCDGQVDEGVMLTFYHDNDGDSYGAGNPILACTQPANSSVNNTDCNDTDANVHPNATEVCNGIDDNCDGQVDEGVKITFYRDIDGDGFGDPATGLLECSAPLGYVTDNTDCNDADPAIHSFPRTATAINGPSGGCRLQSGIVFSVPSDSGSVYSWTLPAGVSGASDSASIVVQLSNTYSGGTITERSSNTCGISDIVSRAIIRYTTKPGTPGIISGIAFNVCSAIDMVYTIAPVINATSYVWTAPANATIVAGQGTTSATVHFSDAFISGALSVAASNCIGTGVNKSLVISTAVPAVPTSIAGTASVSCSTVMTYSCSIVAGAASYLWTLPTGCTFTSSGEQGKSTIHVVFSPVFSTGILTVNAIGTCGGASAGKSITVKSPVPALPGAIGGSATVNCGVSNTYSITVVAGVEFYKWTPPAGCSINGNDAGSAVIIPSPGGGSVTLSASSGFVNGVLTVAAINPCGIISTGRSLTIKAPLLAVPGSISGPATIGCGMGNTYSISLAAGVYTYKWTPPAGCSINDNPVDSSVVIPAPGGASVTLTASPGFISGSLAVRAINTCGTITGARALTIKATASATPTAISGTVTIACNADNIYSITASAGIDFYRWTPPAGCSINGYPVGAPVTVATPGGASVTLNAATGFASGALTVNAINTCGLVSSTRSLTVKAVLPPLPGVITGPASITCYTDNIYSVTIASGVDSYRWTPPAGCSVNGNPPGAPVLVAAPGGASVTLTGSAGFVSGSLAVNAIGTCGQASSARSMPIKAILPLQPGVIAGDLTNVCNNGHVYSVAALAGITSYKWTPPAGCSINGNPVDSAVIVSSSSVTLTAPTDFVSGSIAVASVSSCGAVSAARTLALLGKPSVPTGITPVTACKGQSNLFTVIPAASDLTYTWTTLYTFTGQGASSINVSWGTLSGLVTVKAVNSCGISAAFSKTITVVTCTGSREENEQPVTQTSFNIYPNPTTGNLTVELKSPAVDKYVIHVLDITGRIMTQENIEASGGTTLYNLDLSMFSKGLYIIVVQNENAEYKQQLRVVIE